MSNEKVQLLEKQPVRALWDENAEKWWFSVTDIISVLTDQADYKKTRNYWKWLKNKLKKEESEVVSHTNQLKLLAPDSKMRMTDVADTGQPVISNKNAKSIHGRMENILQHDNK
jgi:cell filamentation protein